MATAVTSGLADTPQQDRDLGLPRERVGKRFVTAYHPELALKICERLANGETLTAICKPGEMPARNTVYGWALRYPAFDEALRAARELQADSLFDEALDLARAVREPDETGDGGRKEKSAAKVRAYDVAMNHLRWSAGRLKPNTYSEKAAVNVAVPIQIVTPLNLGQAGATELEQKENVYEIEATVVEESQGESQDPAEQPEAPEYRRTAGTLVEKRPPGGQKRKGKVRWVRKGYE